MNFYHSMYYSENNASKLVIDDLYGTILLFSA